MKQEKATKAYIAEGEFNIYYELCILIYPVSCILHHVSCFILHLVSCSCRRKQGKIERGCGESDGVFKYLLT